MNEFMMQINHLMNANYAKKYLHGQEVSNFMEEVILVKNHMNAKCARNHISILKT